MKKISKKNIIRGIFVFCIVVVIVGVVIKKNLPGNGQANTVNVSNVAGDEEEFTVPVDYNTDKNYDNVDEHESIRVRAKYKVIDVTIDKEITKEDESYLVDDIKSLDRENGELADKYCLAKITVEITNVGEEEQEIYINTSDLCVFNTDNKFVKRAFINGLISPESNGRSYYRVVLEPEESTTQTCLYVLDEEYLSDEYSLKFSVNPCGQPLDGSVAGDPKYEVDDYISYIDLDSIEKIVE